MDAQLDKPFKRFRVRMRDGWEDAGQLGWQLAPSVFERQEWAPVLWDNDEDPTFCKEAALERVKPATRFLIERHCRGLDCAIGLLRYELKEKREDGSTVTVRETDDKAEALDWLTPQEDD